MKLQWLMPSAHEVRVGAILCGEFYVVENTGRPYSTVRDTKKSYPVLRVDWSAEEQALPLAERALIMDSLKQLAEIKYEQLKENNERTF